MSDQRPSESEPGSPERAPPGTGPDAHNARPPPGDPPAEASPSPPAEPPSRGGAEREPPPDPPPEGAGEPPETPEPADEEPASDTGPPEMEASVSGADVPTPERAEAAGSQAPAGAEEDEPAAPEQPPPSEPVAAPPAAAEPAFTERPGPSGEDIRVSEPEVVPPSAADEARVAAAPPAPGAVAAAEAVEPAVSPRAARARIVAIANQKGGVGKSTTAVNLGAALAELGKRVLVMDLDPQGNASTGLGIDPGARTRGTYQVLAAGEPASSAVRGTSVEGVWAIPSTIDLAGAEIELVGQFSREMRLARAMDAVAWDYDLIFLDCPPSLGLLTVNALSAADELIVPIQCEYYALEGLGQLLRNVRLIQQNLNPRLSLSGIVLTMFDPRTRLSEQVVQEVRRYFGPRVYDTVIPRTVRLSEAPGFGKPITAYDSRSKGARAYRKLAREMLERGVVEDPLPEEEPPSVVTVPHPGGESGPAAGEEEE